jgi:hypothetical protein
VLLTICYNLWVAFIPRQSWNHARIWHENDTWNWTGCSWCINQNWLVKTFTFFSLNKPLTITQHPNWVYISQLIVIMGRPSKYGSMGDLIFNLLFNKVNLKCETLHCSLLISSADFCSWSVWPCMLARTVSCASKWLLYGRQNSKKEAENCHYQIIEVLERCRKKLKCDWSSLFLW